MYRNIFPAPLGKVKATLARAVAITKELDAMTSKYEDLHSRIKQHMGFVNRDMACLEAVIIALTHKHDVSVTKAEQLFIEV